MVQSLIEGCC